MVYNVKTINQTIMKRNYIVTLIVIILVLLGIWLVFFRGNQATAPETTNNDSQELPTDDPNQPIPEGSATNQLANGDAIAVLDQTAGNYVTVDNYVLSQPGFIVIKAAGSGNIVGQSGLLNAGRGQDLEINVRIAAGQSYIAELHFDDGDRHFHAATDLAVMSGDKSVSTTFRVAN